jgi:hypothetical protein
MDTAPGSTQSTTVEECRLLFLRAAALHPKIRLGDSLRTRVLIPMQGAWAELGLPVPNVPAIEFETDHWKAIPSYNRESHRLIRGWAADLNLDYEWVLSAASRQLGTWGASPKNRSAFANVLGYDAPDFIFEPWFSETESKNSYRNRMKAAFRAALDGHVHNVGRARGRMLANRGSQGAHYRWAAEHVCLRWNWKRIADENAVPITWQAVRKAVLPILQKIGYLEGQP